MRIQETASEPFPSSGSASGYATATFIGRCSWFPAKPSLTGVVTGVVTMDMEELRSGPSTEQSDSSEGEQSKSLIANVYSNTGERDPDPYRNLTDWASTEEDIRLAYQVTAAGGLVRRNLKRLTQSGSHEEWYTGLQVALAHRIAQLTDSELPDGREVEGAVPIMEHVSISGDDIMDYLREHPEVVSELDSEELAELSGEAEPEPAEADD